MLRMALPIRGPLAMLVGNDACLASPLVMQRYRVCLAAAGSEQENG